MKTRDRNIDGLKFLMIYFVVLAHIHYNDYGLHLTKMIFSFHMPVFVFLSGYFTSLNANASKQRAWLKQTLIIFLCAQLAHCALTLILGYAASRLHGEPFNTSLLSWKMLIVPAFTLWYLVCLMYWRLVVWSLPRSVGGTTLFVISLLLALASGFVPLDRVLSFQRAFAFFPFFVAGIMFKDKNLMLRLERVGVWYSVVILLACLIVARLLPIYIPAVHYGGWSDFGLRCTQTALAMISCLMIFRLSREGGLERLARWGTYTLWIYIGHSFLIVISRKVFSMLHISLNVFVAMVVAALFCALCITAACMWQKVAARHRDARQVVKN